MFDDGTPRPLRILELRGIVEQLRRAGVRPAAVCLLFSYPHPLHEDLIGIALPNLKVPASVSHKRLLEFGKHERTSTTTLDAYLKGAQAIREPVRTILSGSGGQWKQDLLPAVPLAQALIQRDAGGDTDVVRAHSAPDRN